MTVMVSNGLLKFANETFAKCVCVRKRGRQVVYNPSGVGETVEV